MKERPKAVIDTNIFVSSLLGSVNAQCILNNFILGNFDIVISKDVIEEIIEVISRKKFSDIIHREDIMELIDLLETDTKRVIPTIRIFSCRDPKDNLILECAVSGKVDFIVTGDNDLLKMSPFKNIHIVTPAQFLKFL